MATQDADVGSPSPNAEPRSEDRVQEQAFLAQAGAVLASSLEFEVTLDSLAALTVPRLADWCTIYVNEGDQIHRVGLYHADPVKHQQLVDFHRQHSPLLHDSSPVWYVLRHGVPLSHNDIPDAILRAGSASEEEHRFLQHIGLRCAMVVPMVCRDRVLGAICLLRGDPQQRYEGSHEALAAELAKVAALAVDNARVHREAQRALRAWREGVTIASHEIRTPLSTLQLQIQATLRRYRMHNIELTADRFAELLESFEQQTLRMARLVEQLLDISQLSLADWGLSRERVDLSALVREVTNRLGEVFASAHCVIDLRTDAPVVGQWDRARMEQVLTNLLTNAAKYGAGAPIQLMVEADRDRQLARLAITDQGIGVAPADQQRIFEMFQRATASHARSSLGLGLYIVRRIVEAHGGTVRLRSRLGAGSTFTVELPGLERRGGAL